METEVRVYLYLLTATLTHYKVPEKRDLEVQDSKKGASWRVKKTGMGLSSNKFLNPDGYCESLG